MECAKLVILAGQPSWKTMAYNKYAALLAIYAHRCKREKNILLRQTAGP